MRPATGAAIEAMPGKPEFFWSPPDAAPIVGMTQYRDMIVVATASGVYVIREDGAIGLDRHVVEKLTFQAPKT